MQKYTAGFGAKYVHHLLFIINSFCHEYPCTFNAYNYYDVYLIFLSRLTDDYAIKYVLLLLFEMYAFIAKLDVQGLSEASPMRKHNQIGKCS